MVPIKSLKQYHQENLIWSQCCIINASAHSIMKHGENALLMERNVNSPARVRHWSHKWVLNRNSNTSCEHLRFSRRWLCRMPSSGVWRRVGVVDWTDVSEDRIASIFRVEKSASEEPAWAALHNRPSFTHYNKQYIGSVMTLRWRATKHTRPCDNAVHMHSIRSAYLNNLYL
jgi:hypothetical protein